MCFIAVHRVKGLFYASQHRHTFHQVVHLFWYYCHFTCIFCHIECFYSLTLDALLLLTGSVWGSNPTFTLFVFMAPPLSLPGFL